MCAVERKNNFYTRSLALRLVICQLLYQRLLVGLHPLQRVVLRVEALELRLLLVDHRLQLHLHKKRQSESRQQRDE